MGERTQWTVCLRCKRFVSNEREQGSCAACEGDAGLIEVVPLGRLHVAEEQLARAESRLVEAAETIAGLKAQGKWPPTLARRKEKVMLMASELTRCKTCKGYGFAEPGDNRNTETCLDCDGKGFYTDTTMRLRASLATAESERDEARTARLAAEGEVAGLRRLVSGLAEMTIALAWANDKCCRECAAPVVDYDKSERDDPPHMPWCALGSLIDKARALGEGGGK